MVVLTEQVYSTGFIVITLLIRWCIMLGISGMYV